ncbi:NUDIX domain-containing protein [Bradyrhizobium sp. INPA01-394B]|uniref:NUDIX domain-containing protein n=1 Tax=Bradyrhizobium campsiandrae TaxID=1729892 RepID=A0ABR7UBX9_9BRAD|nr:NUDIX domain-containing protein [Bradyrhizobium campsiandrae]MBC9878160.1 NUDIX domain-containing protein [Bradyrhizobium campsiandrae]MBC9981564.1 NUDIX domain-containing protein [Bradyrhizobium campsiandrae]
MKQDIRDFAAAILVDQSGQLLFQLRDNVPGIVHPGKIALFGGRREPPESPLECIVREVAEEIGYKASPDDFEFLVKLHGADPENIARHVNGEVFVARNVTSSDLVVTEGNLVIVHPSELSKFRSEMTPMTVIAVRAFLNGSASSS